MAMRQLSSIFQEVISLFSHKALIHRFSYVVAGFLIFLVGQTLWGQSFSGRIVGLVTDSSSAAVPDVSVTVVNEGTGAERRLISDVNGGLRGSGVTCWRIHLAV
jgi:hypothetical protein